MVRLLSSGNLARLLPAAFVLMTLSAPAMAEWKAASEEVAAAAKDPRIAAALAAVDAADAALVKDDHAAFAALLAPNLVVNNPQNGVSVRGATGRRNTAGLISYSRYERSIEYAGTLGDLVLLMGDERVVPKGDAPPAGQEVRRRFTDLWKQDGSRWVLAARQATIVAPPGCTASAADSPAIADALHAWYAAEAVGDAAGYHARVTADFHAFDGGKPFIGDGLLDMAKAHLDKGERAAFTIGELAVQLDCRTALATFTTQGSFDSAGRHQDATFLESAELRKEDGQWRLAFFHSTLVPPAPPAATTRK